VAGGGVVIPLGARLVLAGSFGYEVHVAASGLHVRPGGSAYRAACAALALQAQAIVVATSPRSFNREFLKKFDKSSIRLIEQPLAKGPDNVELFGAAAGAVAGPAGITGWGEPGVPPLAGLAQVPFRDLHIHFGRLPPGRLREALELGLEVEPAASLSSYLDGPALGAEPDAILGAVERCSVIFFDLPAWRQIRRCGLEQRALRDRLAVVIGTGAGAVCFADGTPIFCHTPALSRSISDAGSADVFAGAFLVSLLSHRDPSRATVLASEVAAAAAGDYGSEEVFRVRHSIAALEARGRPAVPGLELCEPSRFDGEAAGGYTEVVEATGVFVLREGRLLLIEKPDTKAFCPGVLYVPGGKLEAGESVEQCARRELAEETGLEGGRFEPLGMFHYPDRRHGGRLYRFFQFRATEVLGEPRPSSDIAACQWRDLSDLGSGELFPLTWAQLWLGRLLRPAAGL
jgi:8-oxo-dGTP diphosphatase